MTSAMPAAAPEGACWYFLVAEAEPGLLPRVAGQFAKRSLVPAHFHLSERPDGLHLDIRVDSVDDATASVLAGALRQIVGVRSALMTSA